MKLILPVGRKIGSYSVRLKEACYLGRKRDAREEKVAAAYLSTRRHME
jgi:hypothetical protein